MATTAVRQDAAAGGGMRNVERFAWAAVGYNVLVILWGALVRATGSGAGCGNHWPLCNGQVIPLSPTMHTVIEFTHRCMTGGATFVVLGLLVWTFRATARGQAARVFAVVSTLLLLNEAMLGALLVKLGYVAGNQSVGRMVMLSVHLSNTLLLIAAITLTAWSLKTSRQNLSLLKVTNIFPIAGGLAATLLVGVTGSLAALGDTLFPSSTLREAFAQDVAVGSPWLLRLRGVHPLSAVAAATFVVWLMRRARSVQSSGLAKVVAGLLISQFVIGIADVLMLAPVWMQILHLLGADLYWVALIALAANVAWPEKVATPVWSV